MIYLRFRMTVSAKMNYRLLSLKTSDDLTIQYPLNFLARNCDLISGAVAENLDRGNVIPLPFTSDEMNLFFELLETRKPLPSIEATIRALEIANYMGFNLDRSELNCLLWELKRTFGIDNIEQADEFLMGLGYKKIDISALIHVLTHRHELSEFTGPTPKERYQRFVAAFNAKPKWSHNEMFELALPVIPEPLKHHVMSLIDSGERLVPNEEIPDNFMGPLKMLLNIAQNFLFKEEAPAPQAPQASPAPALNIGALLGRLNIGAVPAGALNVRAMMDQVRGVMPLILGAAERPVDELRRIHPPLQRVAPPQEGADPLALLFEQVREIIPLVQRGNGDLEELIIEARELAPRRELLPQLAEQLRGARDIREMIARIREARPREEEPVNPMSAVVAALTRNQ